MDTAVGDQAAQDGQTPIQDVAVGEEDLVGRVDRVRLTNNTCNVQSNTTPGSRRCGPFLSAGGWIRGPWPASAPHSAGGVAGRPHLCPAAGTEVESVLAIDHNIYPITKP